MSESVEVSLDDLGHLVIPSAFRERLGLVPGMTLIVEEGENDEVRLRPQPESPLLIDKAGILVVRAELLEDLAHSSRQERDRRVATLLQRMEL